MLINFSCRLSVFILISLSTHAQAKSYCNPCDDEGKQQYQNIKEGLTTNPDKLNGFRKSQDGTTYYIPGSKTSFNVDKTISATGSEYRIITSGKNKAGQDVKAVNVLTLERGGGWRDAAHSSLNDYKKSQNTGNRYWPSTFNSANNRPCSYWGCDY